MPFMDGKLWQALWPRCANIALILALMPKSHFYGLTRVDGSGLTLPTPPVRVKSKGFCEGQSRSTNLQLKCKTCDLWIQQTHSQEVFQRIDQQPCRNHPHQGPQFWPTLHPSHKWFSTGKTWECSGCGVSFGPASKAPNKAVKACSKIKQGVAKLSFAKASSSKTETQPDPKQASFLGTEENLQAPNVASQTRFNKASPKTKQAKAKPKPQASPFRIEVPQAALFTSSSGHEAPSRTLPKQVPSPPQKPHLRPGKVNLGRSLNKPCCPL